MLPTGLIMANHVILYHAVMSHQPSPKQAFYRSTPNASMALAPLPGTYHVTVDPSVPPVVHSPCRVPMAIRDDIQAELQEMEKRGIIQ